MFYTMNPPLLVISIAANSSYFCKSECYKTSILVLIIKIELFLLFTFFYFIDASLAIIPNPVQGASNSTLSNGSFMKTFGKSLPS